MLSNFKIVFRVEDGSGNVVVAESSVKIEPHTSVDQLSFHDLVQPDLSEAARLAAVASVRTNCPEYDRAQQVAEMFEAAGVAIAKFSEIKLRGWAKAGLDGTAPGFRERADRS